MSTPSSKKDSESLNVLQKEYSERYSKQYGATESSKKLIHIDDYKSEMVQNFCKFRNENLFTDIFIYVEGVEFACHKVVLCAASCYFKAMFSCDLKESRLGKVFIENISPWTMKRLLDFIYTGKIEVNYENVIEIFNAAVMFQLSKLAEKCSDYIHDHIDLANCIEIHVFSSMHELEQLESDTFQFILDNFMQLINFQSMSINKTTGITDPNDKSPVKNARIPGASSGINNNIVYFGDFVRLDEETFSNLMKSDSLNVSREIYVYYALKKWMDYRILVKNNNLKNNETQKSIMHSHKAIYESLFKQIRLSALTQNEFEYILYNDNMVKNNESLVEQIKYHLDSIVSSPCEVQKKKTSLETIENLKGNDVVTSKSSNNSIISTNINDNKTIDTILQEFSNNDENLNPLNNTVNGSKLPSARIRPSTIPRDYLCLLRSNQFQYYDFYKSKWDSLTSWPPSSNKKRSQSNECCNIIFTNTTEDDDDDDDSTNKDYNDYNKTEPILSGYSTCLMNNILYVIGGYLLNSECKNKAELVNISENQKVELVDQVWMFDPIKNEWLKCKDMLRKRAFHISISLNTNKNHKINTMNTSSNTPTNNFIFLFYGLCYDNNIKNSLNYSTSRFSLKQCVSIEFYNLETDQWSRLKNTDSLLDHHIFQSINNQIRQAFTESIAAAATESDFPDYLDHNNQIPQHETNLSLLNQLIEHQLAQSKLVISLKNLIYILKENCIHCYEFDSNLEQLICLPYFRLPANLSTFILAGAVPSTTKPTSTKSLFMWYSNEEENILNSPSISDSTRIDSSDKSHRSPGTENQEEPTNFKEVLIYLLNMEIGVLYQFYPAKNKLKKLPDLLLKHSSNETFLVDIKSKLYVTGGLEISTEVENEKSLENRGENWTMNDEKNIIEEYDEEKETWSIFINNIQARVSPTTSVFSLEEKSMDTQVLSGINEQKRFFKLKMALV